MCEKTYVGCPKCSEPADSGQIVQVEYRTEAIRYKLNDKGEISLDEEPDYGEEPYCTEPGELICDACGWAGGSLDEECEPEECDCPECDPEAAMGAVLEGDPDSIVLIRRGTHAPFWHDEACGHRDFAEMPPEIKVLAQDRTRSMIAVRASRAQEINDEWLGDAPLCSHIYVDHESPVPHRLIKEVQLHGAH